MFLKIFKKFYTIGVFFISIGVFSQIKIEMMKKGGVYQIPCKVNGVPMNFIFDTGASDVSISLAEAIFMLKNGHISRQDLGEKVYYSIANGDVAEGTKLNIREIEIAGLKLYNVKASIVHNTNAPLLLGLSAISKLGEIKLNGNELTILSGKYSPTEKAYPNTNNREFVSQKSKKSSSKLLNPNTNDRNFLKVFTYSPITDKPSMGEGEKQIATALNNKVRIIKK